MRFFLAILGWKLIFSVVVLFFFLYFLELGWWRSCLDCADWIARLKSRVWRKSTRSFSPAPTYRQRSSPSRGCEKPENLQTFLLENFFFRLFIFFLLLFILAADDNKTTLSLFHPRFIPTSYYTFLTKDVRVTMLLY